MLDHWLSLVRHTPLAILTDLARSLRFFSRLPVPPLPGEADAHGPPDLSGMHPT